VLKSPLFGLNDEQLFTLAHGRKAPLRASLRAKAGDDPMFAEAARKLDDLTIKARTLHPFAFYAHVLGALGGRRHFLERLGVEAADPLDEFLNLALDYERRQTASLQGFLNWVRAAQSEVKRDMEMARDEVRVMTVHGAKGLEAKNVILADSTTTRPEGAYPPRLLTAPIPGAAPDAAALIWGAAKDKDAGPMAEARTQAIEAARDEYRRLLYVAMTRAAERLVVCGTKGEKKIPEGCWHQLVRDALEAECVRETADDGNEVLRYRKGEAPAAPAKSQATAATEISLPPWLARNVAPDRPALRSMTPSSAMEDETRPRAAAGVKAALLRGSLTHRLLQSLPDIAAERRAKAMDDFLTKRGKELPAEERAALASKVTGLLGNARFAALFAPSSRAEVPIVGKLQIGGENYRVSGQVDRLAVTADAVLIGDFKTNRPVPRIAPAGYVRQLALYRAVLAKLYPGKTVRCALIWTENPDLMELSAEALDTALAQITPA
jgi:ATP-dependent helicase/nuclease subunit A